MKKPDIVVLNEGKCVPTPPGLRVVERDIPLLPGLMIPENFTITQPLTELIKKKMAELERRKTKAHTTSEFTGINYALMVLEELEQEGAQANGS